MKLLLACLFALIIVHPLSSATLDLHHSKAEIRGSAEREQAKDCIGAWEDEKTTVVWSIRVDRPCEVGIECLQAAEARSAGNGYDVVIGKAKTSGRVVDTGAWDRFSYIKVGQVKIPTAGEYEVAVAPHPKNNLAVMNLRGLRLSGTNLSAEVLTPQSLRRGVYFSKTKYTPEPLPTFAANRDKLPDPILDANPEYLEMYWKCWELAFQHLRQPQPGSGFVSNYLDEAFNPCIFQWDTVFMVMFARYGHHVFPAVQSLDNFYCKQKTNGFICREIKEPTGEDYHAEGSHESINPPLFSWAEMESYRVTGDKSRFALVLPVLEKYVEWLETGRRKQGTVHGLYWSNGLGCGMDNTPRSGSGWVDMSSQMVLQYHDLAAMCEVLGKTEKAAAFRKHADDIAARINRWMWNEEDGLYYDINDQGEHVKWKTAGCFWPMLAGISSPEQEAKLIANLKDPKSFWRQNIFPTLAADQPGYDPSGGYWLGGVWAPTNYAIIRGLARQGHGDFAREATTRYLDEMHKVFKKTGTVWELYAPDMERHGSGSAGINGKHQARPDFVGWTGCGPIAMVIESLLGFDAQGAKRELTWEVTRTDRHGIRKLRFGDITASLVCAKRANPKAEAEITIQSNRPFTLNLRRDGATKSFQIEKGSTRIRF
ncbi:MAG: hypothetical protein J0M04_04060 [Verrucomicrobia bacterium]|nr:hypothetical protein [Verrucomicrobiota bacterium]